MSPVAAAFPDNSGYVVAAYLVFFAMLLIYVAITAFRLVRIEDALADLSRKLDADASPDTDTGADAQDTPAPAPVPAQARAKDAAT